MAGGGRERKKGRTGSMVMVGRKGGVSSLKSEG